MKRRGFLSRLFKGAAVVGAAAVTGGLTNSIAKETLETYDINDLFWTFDTNKNLYELRNGTWLEEEMIAAMGDKLLLGEDKFSYYNPVYNIYIPIKERYDKRDFEPIITLIKQKKFEKYAFHYMKGTPVLFRMYRDDRNGVFKPEFFSGRHYND